MQTKQKFSSFLNSVKEYALSLRTNRTFLICTLLTVMYLISGYCKWIEVLMSLTALTFMAILPLQSGFCIFMFLHNFTLSNITYDSCFLITFIGYCFILLAKYIIGLKQGKFKFHGKLVLAISWFFAIFLTVSLWQEIYVGGLLYFCYPPLLYLLFAMRSEFKIKQAMNYMFAGLITSCLLGLIVLVFPYYQYVVFSPAERYRAFTNLCNHLYMRTLFILTFYMYLYLKEDLSHLKFGIIYLLCTAITFSTLSKTGMLVFIILSIIFLVLFLKKDFKKNIKIVLILLGCFVLICLIFYKQVWGIISRFIDAFKSEDFVNSILTGRDEIWGTYLNAIFSSPWTLLFGHGLIAQELYVVEQMALRATHNLYIFLLFRFGIVGCIFLGVLIYKSIQTAMKEKPKFIACLPIVYLLIESMFDSTFKCYHFTLFAFAFMILFMTQYEKQETPPPRKHFEKQNNQSKIE